MHRSSRPGAVEKIGARTAPRAGVWWLVWSTVGQRFGQRSPTTLGGMRANEHEGAPGPDADDVVEADRAIGTGRVEEVPAESGRSRTRSPRGRSHRISPRFTAQELVEVAEAAASVNMSTARFCAEAALAAVRGVPTSLGAAQEREALARLLRELFAARTAINRFGTNVNQAVTALNATGEVPEWMGRAVAMVVRSIRQLDDVVAEVDRRLR